MLKFQLLLTLCLLIGVISGFNYRNRFRFMQNNETTNDSDVVSANFTNQTNATDESYNATNNTTNNTTNFSINGNESGNISSSFSDFVGDNDTQENFTQDKGTDSRDRYNDRIIIASLVIMSACLLF